MFRASVRLPVEAPGKFVVLNIAFAGSKLVSRPKSNCGTALALFWLCSVRWNPPPIEVLCAPHCRLKVSSKLQLTVLRGCGLFCAAGSVTVGKFKRYPPRSENMSLLMLPKKLFGDHCQPPRISLTIFDVSVERMPIEPTVRYEVWKPSFANPGNGGSALFRRSGLLRKRCHR